MAIVIKNMARRGRPKTAPPNRKNVASLYGTQEWIDWVDRVADFARIDRQQLIDKSVVEYARAMGFDTDTDPPPKR